MTACLVRSASALATLFVVACATADVPLDPDVTAPLVDGEAPSASPDVYADAAQTWEVPADLLQAIAQTETGGKMVSGQEEIEGWAPAFGVMGLRGEHLTDGARLAGLDEAIVRTDRASNVMAAAALLSSWADEVALDRADLGAWAPLVARYASRTPLGRMAAPSDFSGAAVSCVCGGTSSLCAHPPAGCAQCRQHMAVRESCGSSCRGNPTDAVIADVAVTGAVIADAVIIDA